MDFDEAADAAAGDLACRLIVEGRIPLLLPTRSRWPQFRYSLTTTYLTRHQKCSRHRRACWPLMGPLSIDESLEKDGVFLVESMRKRRMKKLRHQTASCFNSVGGHIDLTVVRADGYERRRLHKWPDTVGEKIDPFAADAIPT